MNFKMKLKMHDLIKTLKSYLVDKNTNDNRNYLGYSCIWFNYKS